MSEQMSFEFQSEARVWIELGGTGSEYASPLKLTISEVARLYRLLGAVLRQYSEDSSTVLMALGDESDVGE